MDVKTIVDRLKLHKRDRIIFMIVFVIMIVVLIFAGILIHKERSKNSDNKSSRLELKWVSVE